MILGKVINFQRAWRSIVRALYGRYFDISLAELLRRYGKPNANGADAVFAATAVLNVCGFAVRLREIPDDDFFSAISILALAASVDSRGMLGYSESGHLGVLSVVAGPGGVMMSWTPKGFREGAD